MKFGTKILYQLDSEMLLHGAKHDQRRDYCTASIKELTSHRSLHGTLVNEDEIHAALAYLHTALVTAYMFLGDQAAARNSVKSSQEHAILASNEPLSFHVLFASAMYFYHQSDSEQAILALQRSILYAHGEGPDQVISVLSWLGHIWRATGAFETALLMYDWAISLSAAPLELMIEKYGCRIDAGRAEQVKASCKSRTSTSCFDVADQVAALLVSGRKRQAIRLARQSLAIARATGSQEWIAAYEFFVARLDF